MMSKIYMAARRVVVYAGEGTTQTDTLFDWLNGLKTEDLDILLKWDLDNLAVDTVISFGEVLEHRKRTSVGPLQRLRREQSRAHSARAH